VVEGVKNPIFGEYQSVTSSFYLSISLLAFRDFLIKMSRFHGCHAADKSQINPRIILMLLLSSIYIVMHINGLIHIWPDLIRICHSLMVEPIAFQLITRILARFINNDEHLVAEIHDTIDKFYKNEEKDDENQKMLTFGVKLIKIQTKLYILLNFICFMTPSVYILMLSWISGELVTVIPLRLPFTDPREAFGFTINISLIIFYSVMFCEIFVSLDLFLIYYTMQIIPMGDIYIHKMRKLSERLSKYRKNEKLLKSTNQNKFDNFQMTRHKLNVQANLIKKLEKDIINQIKSYNSYNNFIALIFPYMHYPSFVAIITNTIGIGLAILVATFLSTLNGICTILVFTLQVLMSCIQGTIVSHQNQEILNEAWNFPWYKMSVPMQKVWLQFMHQCQNSNELKIVIIGVLNMECFTNFINGAYSYFMFILNFVKH